MQNRVAFITGASQGIGRACALALARRGARVIAAARQQDKLEQVVTEICNAGGRAAAVPLDVTSGESVASAFRQAEALFGRIEILVNNAGVTRDGLVMRMKRENWDAVLNTNLTGSFLCIQQVLPGMVRARWGRIINISSVVGETGNPGQANYVAAKAGLIGLTKAVAQEVASRGITVNAVAPGFIDTAMTAALEPAARERLLPLIPLGRMGTDMDVAHAVCFLASDEAGYITGHVLDVNGGLRM
ncbi:MAG TPA: 3-oxoacyl-[acyl-carrier-protein] reductase [Bryobacterales bacterium]|jgi:3-oxoacyl-[acyl-carrier protein] reductase|nr:3-oxoacyl-[acyl-carrier-protein] reductase [Bryobacterales bacterium]